MDTTHVLFAAIWAVYLLLHSALATARMKVWLRAWISQERYRLFFNGVALFGLVFVLWAYFACEPLPLWNATLWSQVLGGVLLLSGVILLKVAFAQYDSGEFFGFRPATSDAPLVIQGLNRYVRHPLYSATFLLLFGWPLLSGSLAAVLLSAIGGLYLIVGTYWEERKLIREFGDDYRAYKARVPRFFPRVF